MTWFARDHTGRPLTEPEREFLAALVDLLSDVQPAQIEAGETALTAERNECLIVLMPHRALGGIAIVVWLMAGEASVVLAQVGGLGISHDSLDLGVWVRDDQDALRHVGTLGRPAGGFGEVLGARRPAKCRFDLSIRSRPRFTEANTPLLPPYPLGHVPSR
jgi:hypothetical protein